MLIHDSVTKSFSIISILDTISSSEFPIVAPHISVFAQIEKEGQEEGEFSFTLEARLGGELVQSEQLNTSFESAQGAQLGYTLGSFILKREGLLTLTLLNGTQSIASCNISIEKKK
jgi:hypothetical protein